LKTWPSSARSHLMMRAFPTPIDMLRDDMVA
jgi:hypothetical protein